MTPFIDLLMSLTTGNIEIRRMIWHPKQGKNAKDGEGTYKEGGRIFRRDTEGLIDFINAKDGDYFFGVNSRRPGTATGQKRDVHEIVGIFVDIDFKKVPREIVDELIKNFKFSPTAIIFSGNGYHIYWLFKTPILINGSQEVIDKAEAIGLGFANHFGSDHVQNIDRILRLPGLANSKYDSRPMCQELFVDGPLYEISDFEEFSTAPLLNPQNRITLGEVHNELPDKFIALKEDDEKIKFIWNKKRSDLNDSSRSGYDMSMAGILAWKTYSPEEIAAVLRQMPSGKGPEATEAYLEYTISKAIESVDTSKRQTAAFAENALSLLEALDNKSSFSNIELALRSLKESVQGMDTLKRAMVREQAVKILEKIGVGSPAKLVDAAIKDPLSGKSVLLTSAMEILMPDPDPWGDEVDGAVLLSEIVAVLNRFVVFPPPDSESLADTVALWIFHSHVINAFSVSPFLSICSVIQRCGKTSLLEAVSVLLPRMLLASNISPAAVFRTVDKFSPSLVVDECDTFMKENEELRGIINASHRKSSAFVVRTEGDDHHPVKFRTWGPKVLARIGPFAITIEDRSIVIQLKRKLPKEMRESMNPEVQIVELAPLKAKIMRWAEDNFEPLKFIQPEPLPDLNDRAMDNWRPLFAVAERVGGEWPGRAEAAARASARMFDEGDNNDAVQLLIDIKDAFKDDKDPEPDMTSFDLCSHLGKMEHRPWSEWKQYKPITQTQLARMLKPFGIRPDSIRIGSTTLKGYKLKDFKDSFDRYIPPPSSQIEGVQAGTPEQGNENT